MSRFNQVTVLGAGRWGTAMAIYLSRQAGVSVRLQCHLESEFQSIQDHQKAPNLPNFSTEGKVSPVIELDQSVEGADLVVISTPVAFLRGQLERLQLPTGTVIVTINKGIERASLKTVPEVVAEYFPQNPLAHLGGPCFPEGLLSEISPAAETIACEDEALGKDLQELFASKGFRVYLSSELKGVALLGALKNIYAIMAGISDGMGMFEEATATLVTRALPEMKRFCDALSIPPETVYGLSGLGDLALTCYSTKSSHNKNFGRRLGQGETIEEILADMKGEIAEGYYTTQAAFDLSRKLKLEMPICQAAYSIIYQGQSPAQALSELMARPLKIED